MVGVRRGEKEDATPEAAFIRPIHICNHTHPEARAERTQQRVYNNTASFTALFPDTLPVFPHQ